MKIESEFSCPLHKVKHTVNVPDHEFRAWVKGQHIQNAMPSLNADERETLLTGMCDEAWDTLIGSDDEPERTDSEYWSAQCFG